MPQDLVRRAFYKCADSRVGLLKFATRICATHLPCLSRHNMMHRMHLHLKRSLNIHICYRVLVLERFPRGYCATVCWCTLSHRFPDVCDSVEVVQILMHSAGWTCFEKVGEDVSNWIICQRVIMSSLPAFKWHACDTCEIILCKLMVDDHTNWQLLTFWQSELMCFLFFFISLII